MGDGAGSVLSGHEDSDNEELILPLMGKTTHSEAEQGGSSMVKGMNSTGGAGKDGGSERNFDKYRPPSKSSLMKRKELEQLNEDRQH